MTYAHFDAWSDAIANRLCPQVTSDAIVAILIPRDDPALFATELAVLKSGGAFLALEPSYPDARLADLIQDASPMLIVADEKGASRLTQLGIPAEDIVVPPSVDESSQPLSITNAEGSLTPSASDLAYVIYTSGTSGKPKGVLIEHRSIVNLVESDRNHFGLDTHDRVAQGSSHAYDSSVEETWLALSVGAAVVVLDDETVRGGPDLTHWLREEQITVFCPPPTLLRTLDVSAPHEQLPGIRLMYVGGEPLPRDIADAWSIGRRLVNGYGPTECAVTTLRADIGKGEEISIGVPVEGTMARVLNEDLTPCANGVEGELVIGGVGVARGYLDRDELTQARFPVHPKHGRIYRTGDRVRQDASGAFYYLGRMDAQVKLHGHRIELEEVEAHLTRLPGVANAAACVRRLGEIDALIGFVVSERDAQGIDEAALLARLQTSVPATLVPARIYAIDRLPTLPSGKLDRDSLLVPTIEFTPKPDGPNDVESVVFRAVSEAVGRASAGRQDDFFFDLGGNSVGAALAVSKLRKDPRTASISVRDIYELRTIDAIATKATTSDAVSNDSVSSIDSSMASRRRPLLVTTCQGIWLLAETVVGAATLYAIFFLLLPFVLHEFGLTTTLLALPLASFIAFLLYAPLSVALLVLAKRVLIGRYRSMRVPVWSGFYLRHWLLAHLARFVPWGALSETVFFCSALRALGAQIGERVHIHRGVALGNGGWDLLHIGDDVCIGRDASIRLIDYDRGDLVIGPVSLGDRCVLETRAGVDAHTTLDEDSHLTSLSWLPQGKTLPDGERWNGVPAKRVERLGTPIKPSPDRPLTPLMHGVAMMMSRFAFGTLAYYAPFALLLIAWPGVDTAFVLDGLFAGTGGAGIFGELTALIVVSLLVTLVSSAVAIRLLAYQRPAVIWNLSLARIRDRLASDAVSGVGRLLSGSLFWPVWLRFAGMKVGSKSEISTITDVVPSSVALGSECFLADGIYLGGARIRQGVVEHGATSLGGDSFLGNHAVVPAGSSLPSNLLVGVATVADDEQMTQDSTWFGHPAFTLPRREVVNADRRLTHDPGPVQYVTRIFFESLRFLIPIVPLFILLVWLHGVSVLSATMSSTQMFLWLLPVSVILAAATLGLLVLFLKWTLLGRVRPGQHALWSCWCCRWDFVYVCWNAWIRGLMSAFEGTLFLAWYLRAMGMRVGKRVVLGGGFAQVVDPDMISIDDEATVSGHFQAHTFEDRILKIDTIRIGKGATVRDGAILFYGSDIGEGACVMPQSVVMKRERLSSNTTFAGSPTKPIANKEREVRA